MNQLVNEKYAPLFENKTARYFIFMGGRAAGRSTVASQYAIANLFGDEYFRCAIMRFIYGDIKNSIFKDIQDQLELNDVIEEVNVTEHFLKFERGQNSINGLGFKKSSGDQKAKLKSLANYSCVIIEEADEISEEDFIQLDDSLRTVKGDIKVIFLLNPPSKNHWIIKTFFNLEKSDTEGFYIPTLKRSRRHDTVFIHTTYQDNIKNISQKTKDNYESYRKKKPDHYHNMIRGLVSEGARGRIYKNWKTISTKEFNKLDYPSYYVLDFGFSNHPASLNECKMHNQSIWARELIYETGMTNGALSRRFEQLKISQDAEIIADSAEPKSIQELQEFGWNVIAAEKGPDSIRAGIDMLLEMEVFYTEDSTNIAMETQEYKWALDKNKEPTNEPVDENNHAMDGIRYGVFTKRGRTKPGVDWVS